MTGQRQVTLICAKKVQVREGKITKEPRWTKSSVDIGWRQGPGGLVR